MLLLLTSRIIIMASQVIIPQWPSGWWWWSNWRCHQPDGQIYRWSGEQANFWAAIRYFGFDTRRTYTSTVTGTFNSGASDNILNAPIAVIGTNASIKFHSFTPGGYANLYYISNSNLITNANRDMYPPGFSAAGHTPVMLTIKPVDILAVDSKIDDGVIAIQRIKNVRRYKPGRWTLIMVNTLAFISKC